MFSVLGLAVSKTTTATVTEIVETSRQRFSIHKIGTSFQTQLWRRDRTYECFTRSQTFKDNKEVNMLINSFDNYV